MKPIDEVTLRKQFLSTNSPPSDEIVFLHTLLNYHLGPPDDQLPVIGSGARNFGPRTKAKVQRFHRRTTLILAPALSRTESLALIHGKCSWRNSKSQ